MARIRANFANGRLNAGAIAPGDVTLSSEQFITLPNVSGGSDYIPIVLDPDNIYGAREIVHITTHVGANTVSGVQRGQEGTDPVAHNVNVGVQETWRVAPLVQDFSHSDLTELGNDDHPQYFNVARHEAAGAHNIASIRDDLFPAGFIWLWPGHAAQVPSGWLVFNGQAVSRTAYARLFDAIGVVWGIGDGVSTFNLPPSSALPLIENIYGDANIKQLGMYLEHTHSFSATTGNGGSSSNHVHSFAAGVGVTSQGESANHTHVGVAGTGSRTAGVSNDHNHRIALDGLTVGGGGAQNPHTHAVSGATGAALTMYGNGYYGVIKT